MSRHEPVMAAAVATLRDAAACPAGASPVQTIVVAVSGGPDSVCLLDVLSRLLGRPAAGRRGTGLAGVIHVAHLHHGLRGRAADLDAAFVRRLAGRYGWPVTIGRADVRGRAAEGKRSIQETAREVRYQFLADVAHRINASWIAVGHTATDQAETLLLRLLRGTGPDGLAGMPVVRDGWIIRPLLGVTREAVLDYARRRGLAWRRDRSNRDPHYTRSRVRMDLLPRLAKDYNPAIVSTLAATARLMAEERQTVDEMLSTMWEQALVAMGPHALSFHRVTIAQQPASVQRWWLRRALRCVQGGPAGTWRRIDEILRRMARVVEGAVALQGGIEVRLTAGRVTVVRRAGPAGDRAARTMRTREREWNSGFSASH